MQPAGHRIIRRRSLRPAILENLIHRKSCITERIHNLLPHLKTVRPYSRPYDCLQISSASAIPALHVINNLTAKLLDSAPPSVMNRSNSPMNRIIKQNRNTICRPHRDCHARNIGGESINPLQFITSGKRIRNFLNHSAVHLMRLHNIVREYGIALGAEGIDIGRNIILEQSFHYRKSTIFAQSSPVIMKKFVLPLFMFLALSCQNDEIDNRTPASNKFDISYAQIEFGADGGRDTVNIPFDDCYLHMVRNDSLYIFFYLEERDYQTLDSTIQSRSIITRPRVKEVDPEVGFSYFEWEWFSAEIKDNQVIIDVKPGQAGHTAQLKIPCKKLTDEVHRSLEITLTRK